MVLLEIEAMNDLSLVRRPLLPLGQEVEESHHVAGDHPRVLFSQGIGIGRLPYGEGVVEQASVRLVFHGIGPEWIRVILFYAVEGASITDKKGADLCH